MMNDIKTDTEIPVEVHLGRIARELVTIRTLLASLSNSMSQAESEIPEKIRRFCMYMHDIHSVSYMYEERGLAVPHHILREMERCDDRLRHLLDDLHNDGGTFEKVRREMTERGGNRYDHTRLLTNGDGNEARQS